MRQELLSGVKFIYDNSSYCDRNQIDDIRQAEVWYKEHKTFGKRFYIEFNGKIIHSYKTFKSFEIRLNKVIAKWNLEMVEIQDDLEWIPNEADGNFYAINEDTLLCCPMLADGTRETLNKGDVDERAFAEEDEQPFVDSMVKLFGESVLECNLIKCFTNINRPEKQTA